LNVLDTCMVLAAHRTDWALAARMFGAAGALLERMAIGRPPGEEEFLASAIAQARQQLGLAASARHESAGRSLDDEQATAEARAWLQTAA
jgi:hypothetical protein